MTASEHLRQWDGAMMQPPWPMSLRTSVGDRLTTFHIEDDDAVILMALRNALPLIADCIEAAEKQAALVADEEIEWRWPGLGEALTALREHLEGGDE